MRIVVDRRLRLPLTAHVIAEAARRPTWVLTLPSADPARRRSLLAAGVNVIDAGPDRDGHIDLAGALAALGERGLTRLLVEGGGRLAAALLRAGLVDRLAWFRAPLRDRRRRHSGGRRPRPRRLADAPRFVRVSSKQSATTR